MGTEPKKISFGFNKTIKKVPEKIEEKKQYIDCLEGKSIKVKGGELIEEEKPLVIPLKSKTTTAASLMRIAEEVESGIMDNVENTSQEVKSELIKIENIPNNENIDAMAIRELMEDANKSKNMKKDESTNNMVIPTVEAPILTGEKESSLEDYENIPIQHFGLAMLRGMGWAPGKGMGKHKAVDLSLPNLRPKGMGLGADKITIQQKNGENNQIKKEEEELKVVVGCFVKIIAGKHNGAYGQISGFDEDSGRLIVKTALGGTNLALNEFLVQAVTKIEYQSNSKVLNSAKYEEYKIRDENRHKNYETPKIKSEKESYDKQSRKDDRSSPHVSNRHKSDRSSPYELNKHRNIRSDERSSPYISNKHRSNKSDDRSHSYVSSKHKSDKEDRSSKHHSKHSKEERRHYSSESSDDSSSDVRSRDKKRKGKKKKRDRSRSREHRRH